MVDSSGQRVNLSGLCGSVDGTSNPRSTARVFRAPIKYRRSGIPVIEVRFNDQQTYDMILDTGASGTLITRRMALELGVRPVGAITSTIADGSQVRFQIGYIGSMQVNGAEARNVRVAIADRLPIGLLGQDFFDRYDLKIKQDVVEFYVR